MNLVKCNNGHFYDQDRFQSCPHCGGAAGNDNVTMPIVRNDGDDDVTVALTQPGQVANTPIAPEPIGSSSLQAAVNIAAQDVSINPLEDDNKTVGFFSSAIGKEPVAGWLVCTEGEHFGEDFRLKSGRNFVGRSPAMDVSLQKDTTVSREKHAVVVYEPRGNTFIIQPGDSKELCYLNDKVVLMAQELKANDRLGLGKSELMFIPCCSPEFNWDKEGGK